MKKTKEVIFWLTGEKAGRTIVGAWSWLWGISVESGGKIAVEVAKESLESMEKEVAQLAEAVSTIKATYEGVKAEYEAKQKEYQEAENTAKLAHKRGNDEAARLAIGKAIAIEKLLPAIAARVQQIEKYFKDAQEKFRQRKEKLEIYRIEMENLKSLHKINDALGTITAIDGDFIPNTAQEQFTAAQEAIQERANYVNAFVELSENFEEKILDDLIIEDEINRRLSKLD